MQRLADVDRIAVARLLLQYNLTLRVVASDLKIPGSYWGDSEAGLKAGQLFARLDTPVHSILHETAHYICMSPERRADLDRDAGGDDAEETAVCYLQLLLAAALPRVGVDNLAADMDEWGYSFRLGSARLWFETDADEARLWLVESGVIDGDDQLTGLARC